MIGGSQEPNDHELLAQFTQQNSEAAFGALVARHVNLVYSVALRKTGRPDAAEEIAQATFIILARKARGLPSRTVVAGWLCETARLTAANYLRTEIRRQKREQEAHVQSILNEPPAEDLWKQITPLLDDALSKLGTPERNAVVLRFFENENLRDVGAALGVSEDAAKRRVHRALEKLRKIFLKRGVTLSTLALGGMLAANSVQAAPVALAATISVTAAPGTALSAALTTLVNATMKTMTWLKFKFAVGVGVAALLAGGATTIIISESGGAPTVAISQSGGTTPNPQTGGNDSTWTPQEIAKLSQDTYAALTVTATQERRCSNLAASPLRPLSTCACRGQICIGFNGPRQAMSKCVFSTPTLEAICCMAWTCMESSRPTAAATSC